jgi:hypothetical protein
VVAVSDRPSAPQLSLFLKKAGHHDQAIYDRLSKAYTRSGYFDWADEVWCKRIPVVRDIWWLSVIAVMIPLALYCGLRFRLGSVISHGNSALLALDIFLPDLVDLNARDRFKGQLEALPMPWQIGIAFVRLTGWLIIPGIIWLVTIRLGRG